MAEGFDDIQTRVFFTGEYTEAVETSFVKGLLREAIAGNYKEGSVNNGTSIRKVMNEINICLNKSLDYKFCYNIVRRLRQRYEAFTRILGVEGVTYTQEDNEIHCDQLIWDEISKSERLALAYRVHGEIRYDALCRIFLKDEDDSIEFNILQPITNLSSSLNSLSLMSSRFPPIEESAYSSFWNDLVGNSSMVSDAGN